MTVKFKVVGTNKVTSHLMEKELTLLESSRIHHGTLKKFSDGEKTYLLDEKSVDFLSECVLVQGILSDDTSNVGRVALEFIPQK